MEITKEKIAFLVKLAGGTPEMENPDHPQHLECIQRSVDNAFTVMETAQEYAHQLDEERFDRVWKNL